MKAETHLEKIRKLKATLSKLEDEEDHETIVELCLLISAHYINATLHLTGRLRPDRDIRHNRIFGDLTRENYLDTDSSRIGGIFKELENMRPSHVYGKGENGKAARKAKSLYKKIKDYCEAKMNV